MPPVRRPISLLIGDPKLAGVLRERLNSASGRCVEVVQDTGAMRSRSVVITTTNRCSPVECAGLTSDGGDVIVLAALPSHFEAERYEIAGAAAYLPMSLDLGPLIAAVAALDQPSD